MGARLRRAVVGIMCAALLLSAAGVLFATGKAEAPATEAAYTLGISNFRDSFEFCWKVHQNIEEWAKKYGIKTVYAEANMEPEKIKANLDTFALQKVDAIFEFNWITDVTAKFVKEHPDIVVVTGDYVVDGAYYFGANQYQAGVILGRYLAEQVKKRWNGQVDAMVFAACYQCGELLIQRMDGIRDGYKETYPNFPDDKVFRFENAGGEGQEINTRRIVTDFYTAHPDMTHIVVGTNNDEGGLGALSAVETMGKEENFFIVSHGGDTPFREKLRAGKGDVWIGSVAYMPERYGEFMIPWLKDILDGKDVPKEMSPEHFVLTAENVDEYYPND
jgi:ribose transport system substrate-binding protein